MEYPTFYSDLRQPGTVGEDFVAARSVNVNGSSENAQGDGEQNDD